MTDNVIVRDSGFTRDDWKAGFDGVEALDLASDASVEGLSDQLSALKMIRVDFPSFADGRGFTLGRLLRLNGFTGRLRAKGHVLADQYSMARRAGFDEVEIDANLAARQPADQWIFRSDWRANDYQSRLRAQA